MCTTANFLCLGRLIGPSINMNLNGTGSSLPKPMFKVGHLVSESNSKLAIEFCIVMLLVSSRIQKFPRQIQDNFESR